MNTNLFTLILFTFGIMVSENLITMEKPLDHSYSNPTYLLKLNNNVQILLDNWATPTNKVFTVNEISPFQVAALPDLGTPIGKLSKKGLEKFDIKLGLEKANEKYYASYKVFDETNPTEVLILKIIYDHNSRDLTALLYLRENLSENLIKKANLNLKGLKNKYISVEIIVPEQYRQSQLNIQSRIAAPEVETGKQPNLDKNPKNPSKSKWQFWKM